ncbi:MULTISPECIES: sugar-binding transcriptional regulator [unclassified Corynebacterium]|uniref:sugar-binding transcriptional regulator n=1 Tax=unclassified Corynebacterium TaxID=2624378 RepID=UPI00352652AF
MCTDAKPNEREHVAELLTVARLYYEQHLSQGEIADLQFCSRSRISRLLKEARDRHMVRTTVHHPLEQSFELERQLRRHLGLERVFVASALGRFTPAQAVGRLAADIIQSAGHRQAVIALSNGRSVAAVVDSMPRQNWPLSVVCQMVGSFGRSEHHAVDAPDLTRNLANQLGGGYRLLPVPIVMRSTTAARWARREEMMVTTLELAARADIAVIGVGSVGQGSSSELLQPFITPQISRELKKHRVVAHFSGHHFDVKGRHVHTVLCDRTISLEPERLKKIDLPLMVAWGWEKVAAISAISRTDINPVLVTDSETATLLLDYRA